MPKFCWKQCNSEQVKFELETLSYKNLSNRKNMSKFFTVDNFCFLSSVFLSFCKFVFVFLCFVCLLCCLLIFLSAFIFVCLSFFRVFLSFWGDYLYFSVCLSFSSFCFIDSRTFQWMKAYTAVQWFPTIASGTTSA